MTRVRSIRMLALAMMTLALVPACGDGDPGGPAATANVSGVVKTATGAVIAGASVTIGSATVTTNANGRFEFQNLPIGSVTIVATAPGFDARSENVSLSAGMNVRDVVLTQPTATVSGVVKSATGAVIAGASVKIGSATATSGADGRFEITNVPVGSVTITASAPGYDPLSESVSLVAGINARDVVLIRQPTASVSGVVKATSGAVIAGASVKIGTAAATTDANGQFELQDVPVGTATITTTALRFDPRSEAVSLNAGPNTHDVVMTPQTLFTHQNLVAYLPQGVAEYKAAIVFLPGLMNPATGLPLDSRGLVSGTSDGTCSIWCLPAEKAEVRSRALALHGGNVALIGTTTLTDNPGSYATLLQALSEFGAQSLHPELANIPIMFVGHSMGGCTSYGFSRVHGAQVAGFVTMKGGCHNNGPALAAAAVPGYFLIGGLDELYRRDNITAAFEGGRALGAPWALSTDDLHHNPMADFDQMFEWMDAVLTARVPATAGAPLRPMTEADGWLGDRSSGAISTYACYPSTRSLASWLPTQETALNWQMMAEGTLVVTSCAP